MSDGKRLEKIESWLVDSSTDLIEKYIPALSYIVVLVCFIIWVFFGVIPDEWSIYRNIITFEEKISESLLNKDKTNMLITVGIFLVGYYVTVMSVLGSSYSSAMVKISEEGLSKKFVRFAVIAFLMGFVFLIITVVYDLLKPYTFFTIFYLSLIFLTLSQALRFSTVVMHIYYSNIKHAAEEIRKKAETEKTLMELLLRMESRIGGGTTPSPDSKEYMDDLRKKLKENETLESKKDNDL